MELQFIAAVVLGILLVLTYQEFLPVPQEIVIQESRIHMSQIKCLEFNKNRKELTIYMNTIKRFETFSYSDVEQAHYDYHRVSRQWRAYRK